MKPDNGLPKNDCFDIIMYHQIFTIIREEIKTCISYIELEINFASIFRFFAEEYI
jgi:hypothetical protein